MPRDAQHQPQSARSLRLRHLRVFPMKPSPLAVFVLILNPKAHLIPGRFCLVQREIRHHADRFFIPRLRAHDQRSAHAHSRLTPFSSPFPSAPWLLHPLPNGAKAFFSLLPKRQILFGSSNFLVKRWEKLFLLLSSRPSILGVV